jgi:hypothetical protein
MGPIALFDKSFLQSLSLDESVFFDHFFLPVICPLFYVETLADLEKHVREGRTPEQEVGIIADKVPVMHGYPCAYHLHMGVANLLGNWVPMDGRIPSAGGRAVKVDGKAGFAHGVTPEAEAFNRWQAREFLRVEREFARAWREALEQVAIARIAEGVRALGITPQTCKSLEDAGRIVRRILGRGGSTAAQQIRLALRILDVPPEYEGQVLARWRVQGRSAIAMYAPYSAHVLAVELFFQVALGANLISTEDSHNRTDTAYLFYTPFCHVFISSDHLHRRCAPLFLRSNQSFVWGHDLKKDLNRLMTYYASRPEHEKEQGLTRLAPTPPVHDKDSLIVQLWDRHLLPVWRRRGAATAGPVRQETELVEHVNRVSSAPALRPEDVDFEPADADFVLIQRSIPKRKGSWWQLPKDLKG